MPGGQPGALLALPKAGKLSNPYCDTVQNGFALGKSGTHDPQLDAKALLPTHTFPPCWNLRKSPKRPALPGAVSRVWGGSPTHTLSPAVKTPCDLCSMLGHCEPPTVLSKLTFERKKIPFSIVGFRTPMRCLCRPGRACFFLFCLPLIFLTDSSSSETETGFLSSGFVATLRFVRNCPTRLQRGG